jgi:MIP family channel proteins
MPSTKAADIQTDAERTAEDDGSRLESGGAFSEFTSWSTYRLGCVELIGTFLFIFLAVGCPIISDGVSSRPCSDGHRTDLHASCRATREWACSALPSTSASLFQCLPTLLVASVVSMPGSNGRSAGQLSPDAGCHLNPAVTLSFVLLKKMSIFQGVVYVVGQLLGAIFGALVVFAITYTLIDPQTGLTLWHVIGGATNYVRPIDPSKADTWDNQAIAASFIGEMVGTGVLVFVVNSVSDEERNEKDKHNLVLGPLIVGLAVFVANITLIPLTNCSINPARSFGPAIVYGNAPSYVAAEVDDKFTQTPWSFMWLFWVAPCLGSVIATMIWQYIVVAPSNRVYKLRLRRGGERDEMDESV